MPCYSPLRGYRDADGKMVFKNDRGKAAKVETVACSQCLGCRLDRARMWAARCTHEAALHDIGNGGRGSAFVTLTYRDREACTTQEQLDKEHYILPSWSLSTPEYDDEGRQVSSSHFQRFMKSLRKARKGHKIKFFQAGEYGNKCKHGFQLDQNPCPLCKVGRPHHHAILFGVSFDDLEEYASNDGKVRYTSPELESLWKRGRCDVGNVTFQSAGYVARYCLKKITGEAAEEHYRSVDLYGEITQLAPEYSTQSKGIGKAWFEKYRKDLYPSDVMPVPGHGNVPKLPRYYDGLMEAVDPILLEAVKQRRQEFRDENADEYTSERLMAKYKVKKAQIAPVDTGR